MDCRAEPGRSAAWLKAKCIQRQEFVVGGFTDAEAVRGGIGSLLVGAFEGGRLRFTGKVGTGYTRDAARALRQRLEPLRIDRCPFAEPPEGWIGRNAHWVEPRLVAEVAFSEWTEGGRIRHPSFQGLREDKPPKKVARE